MSNPLGWTYIYFISCIGVWVNYLIVGILVYVYRMVPPCRESPNQVGVGEILQNYSYNQNNDNQFGTSRSSHGSIYVDYASLGGSNPPSIPTSHYCLVRNLNILSRLGSGNTQISLSDNRGLGLLLPWGETKDQRSFHGKGRSITSRAVALLIFPPE